MNHYGKRFRPSDEMLAGWLDQIKTDWNELIHEAGFPPDSELERAAHFIFYGFASQDSRNIHRFTGWNLPWVVECRERARQAGIWLGNCRLHLPWMDEPKDDHQAVVSMVEFVLDVMIVGGHMERLKPKYDPRSPNRHRETTYRLTPKGLKHAERIDRTPGPTHKELCRLADDGNPNC